MTKLVVVAMMQEASDFLKSCQKVKKLEPSGLYEVIFNHKKFYLLVSGVGTINTAYSLTLVINKLLMKVSQILNIGYAGGYNLLPNSFYEIKSCFFVDSDLTVFGHEKFLIPDFNHTSVSGFKTSSELPVSSLLTSNAFQTKPVPGFDSYACDMEGAVINYIAYKFNRKVRIIKYISDLVAKEDQINNYENCEQNASSKIADFIKKFLLED